MPYGSLYLRIICFELERPNQGDITRHNLIRPLAPTTWAACSSRDVPNLAEPKPPFLALLTPGLLEPDKQARTSPAGKQ